MHEVVIVYCQPCGYLRKAQAAADAVRGELGLSVKLEPGKAGIYEVRVGDEVVLRRKPGWFPAPGDVVEAVRSARTRPSLERS